MCCAYRNIMRRDEKGIIKNQENGKKNDPTAKCQLSEDVNDDFTTFSVLIHCWTAKINFHLIFFYIPY